MVSFVHPEKNYQRPGTGLVALEAMRSNVRNLEERLETRLDKRLEMITSQVEGLTLNIKKNQSGISNSIEVSSYCRNPGQFAIGCPENP